MADHPWRQFGVDDARLGLSSLLFLGWLVRPACVRCSMFTSIRHCFQLKRTRGRGSGRGGWGLPNVQCGGRKVREGRGWRRRGGATSGDLVLLLLLPLSLQGQGSGRRLFLFELSHGTQAADRTTNSRREYKSMLRAYVRTAKLSCKHAYICTFIPIDRLPLFPACCSALATPLPVSDRKKRESGTKHL